MNFLEPTTLIYREVKKVGVATIDKPTYCPLEYSVSFYNHLNDDATIVMRNGIPFKIPRSGSRENSFVVRYTFRIDSSVTIDPVNVFHHSQVDSPEHRAFLSAITACEENKQRTNKSFSIEYTVTRDEITSFGGVLYLAELDLVISVLDERKVITHPYNDTATRWQLIDNEVNVNNIERFGYSMYLISNDGAYTDRYININGEVYRVPAVKNHSLRDGVYLCSSGPSASVAKAPMPVVKRYDFEQAEKELRLYKTPEDAASFGDILEERKKELAAFELDIKHQESELKTRKIEVEQEIVDKKHLLETLELQRKNQQSELDHERNLRSMRDKDYYETRSTVRKDSSEAFKYIPVVLTGVIAIASFFFKISAK